MTVSTISNVASAAARAQENQNRQTDTKLKTGPQSATLPTDIVTESAAAASTPLTQDEARSATETQNREAAASVLRDDDFPAEDTSPQEKVQQQAVAAMRAQTTKLPPNLIALISE